VPLYFYVFYVAVLVLTPAVWLYAPLLDLPLVAMAGAAVLLAVQQARARRRRAAAGG
jgi:membrane protein implicated in regulation of membrane protease activity